MAYLAQHRPQHTCASRCLDSSSVRRYRTQPGSVPSRYQTTTASAAQAALSSSSSSAASAATKTANSENAHKYAAGVRFAGCGAAAPALSLSNDDLSQYVETNDEWIRTRTGIGARRVLSGGETVTQLAADASREAMEMAGVTPEDVDLILFATSTPDDLFGGACLLQGAIGASNAVAFDITAACSGFVVSLATATSFIRSGAYKTVLVVGADALSRQTDWRDRTVCVLFGDGAGAAVLTAAPSEEGCNVLGYDMKSDGSRNMHLVSPYSVYVTGEGDEATTAAPEGGRPATNAAGRFGDITMNGQEVFKFAVSTVPVVIESALDKAGLEKEDVDWLVMHQANQRILDAAAKRMKLPSDRVVSNLAKYGNTSAASVPLALSEAVSDGRIKDGDVLALAGFGAGLTWAGMIVKWGK
ncbi:hypothetical protein PPROV_001106300 [Pycnococcus provasolii]|uniref:beta-ketoacyl-[acyl-carrier-protein] synthase III n=1 Tax=Pycnococcus provasolii TaxID=41880 RepID=A0A830I0D8_9CHLO|nr:hypothetical protein PPROV_001106300 [Pycnococcus provasolii]